MNGTMETPSYRTRAELFANKILMNKYFLWDIGELTEEKRQITASDILKITAFAEAVAFNENLLFTNGPDINDFADDLDDELPISAKDIVRALVASDVLDDSSTLTLLRNEFLKLCSDDTEFEIILDPVYGKLYRLVDGRVVSSVKALFKARGEDNRKILAQRAMNRWKKEQAEAIIRHGYLNKKQYDNITSVWMFLADVHGIPYITDEYYVVRDVQLRHPTNIGLDLFKRLEKIHREYFENIRNYLGPSYAYIPPILTLVLENCKSISDLPRAILSVRGEFQDFRSRCTKLEIELRNARTYFEQVEIIKEIELVYEGVSRKVREPNRRILNRVFDIVKEIDPADMGAKALEQARDLFDERNGIIQIKGYYDIWTSLTKVKQNDLLLERVFGKREAERIMTEMKVIDARIGQLNSKYHSAG